MSSTITNPIAKLIKKKKHPFLDIWQKITPCPRAVMMASFFVLLACQSENKLEVLKQIPESCTLEYQGTEIKTRLATTTAEQNQGLSGVKSHQFKQDEAMLFFYTSTGPRPFWMPDTYFDLDIFYLDKEFKVIDINRNVPHHPGREEPIPRARNVYSKHVLEMRADSPIAKKIKVGSQLNWTSRPSPEQIELSIRPGR
jgi:hypothetical protein